MLTVGHFTSVSSPVKGGCDSCLMEVALSEKGFENCKEACLFSEGWREPGMG